MDQQEPGGQRDKPLFKQMDAQEQIYAPPQQPRELSDDLDEGRSRAATEPVVPGTPTTAIDTPIPGAKAIAVPLDREDDATHSRER